MHVKLSTIYSHIEFHGKHSFLRQCQEFSEKFFVRSLSPLFMVSFSREVHLARTLKQFCFVFYWDTAKDIPLYVPVISFYGLSCYFKKIRSYRWISAGYVLQEWADVCVLSFMMMLKQSWTNDSPHFGWMGVFDLSTQLLHKHRHFLGINQNLPSGRFLK